MLRLAAEFWIEHHRRVDPSTAKPLLSHPALPFETAERIAVLGAESAVLVAVYLTRNDPVDVMARRIDATCLHVLWNAVLSMRTFPPAVAELVADVDDLDV